MLKRLFIFSLVFMLSTSPLEVFAEELTDISDEEVMSVLVPVFYEDGAGVLDYILDPYGILDEAEYNEDLVVESSEHFYFRNYEGEYDYSHVSDDIVIANESDSKVSLSLSLELKNIEYTGVSSDRYFEDAFEYDKPQIYLALLDSDDNEIPVDSSGKLEYSTVLESKSDDDSLDEFHFRLVGDCSTVGDWRSVSVLPEISLIMRIEPINEEEDDSVTEDSSVLGDEQLEALPEEELLTEETEIADVTENQENHEEQEEPNQSDGVTGEAVKTEISDLESDKDEDADSTVSNTDVVESDSSDVIDSTSSITN